MEQDSSRGGASSVVLHCLTACLVFSDDPDFLSASRRPLRNSTSRGKVGNVFSEAWPVSLESALAVVVVAFLVCSIGFRRGGGVVSGLRLWRDFSLGRILVNLVQGLLILPPMVSTRCLYI